jgi:hypothetical protein
MTAHSDEAEKRSWKSAAGVEYYVFVDERDTSSPIVWFVNVEHPSLQSVRRALEGTTLGELSDRDLEGLLQSPPTWL